MYKRRKKLVRLDIQFRVVLIALLVASLVLLVNFHLSLTAVDGVSAKWASSLEAGLVLKELKSCLIGRFVLSIGLLVPLAVGLGVVYSFKFAGPIYKFKKFFTELKTGLWSSSCWLRKGDDLQDLCGSINDGLRPIQTFLGEHRTVLSDVHEMLENGDSCSPEQVADLKGRIRDALDVYAQRLPPKAAQDTPSAPAAGDESESASEEQKHTDLQAQA